MVFLIQLALCLIVFLCHESDIARLPRIALAVIVKDSVVNAYLSCYVSRYCSGFDYAASQVCSIVHGLL